MCPGECDDREALYQAANSARNASSMYLEPFYLLNLPCDPYGMTFYATFCTLLVFWCSNVDVACSSPFWRKMESIFAPVSLEDSSYLKQQVATKNCGVDLIMCHLILGLMIRF